MREPLHPPTEPFSDEQLGRIRSYLDGQSRIDLALWVQHEHMGVSGPIFDHHTLLGLADAAYEELDVGAIEFGVENEVSLPGWVDLYPLSEVERVRDIGTVMWERSKPVAPGLDPLDFQMSYEGVEAPPELVASVSSAVETAPSVVSVELSRVRLLKADREVWSHLRAFVICDERGPIGDVVRKVDDALRLYYPTNFGVSAGESLDPRIAGTTVFERQTKVDA